MKTVWTIGYEGCEIEEFVRALASKKVQIVVDVRKNPVSRKPGFNKSRLAAKLGAAAIEYMHLPALGVPTEWRKLAKAEVITRKKMFRDYEKKVLPLAEDEIALIKGLMKKSRVAILCYETDASDCHRKYVSEKVAPPRNIKNLDMLALTRKARTLGKPSARARTSK